MRKIIVGLVVAFVGIVVAIFNISSTDPFELQLLLEDAWEATLPIQAELGAPWAIETEETDTEADIETEDDAESEATTTTITASTTTATPVAPIGGVTPKQAAALKSVGINPDTVVTMIAAKEPCFVDILGQARVDEIKAGDVPSTSEFFSVRGCI